MFSTTEYWFLLRQLGKHGQCQDLTRRPFRDQKIALAVSPIAEAGLQVQRQG